MIDGMSFVRESRSTGVRLLDDWYWKTDDGKRIQVSDKKDAKERFQCVRGITRMMGAKQQSEVLLDLVFKLHAIWHKMQRATRDFATVPNEPSFPDIGELHKLVGTEAIRSAARFSRMIHMTSHIDYRGISLRWFELEHERQTWGRERTTQGKKCLSESIGRLELFYVIFFDAAFAGTLTPFTGTRGLQCGALAQNSDGALRFLFEDFWESFLTDVTTRAYPSHPYTERSMETPTDIAGMLLARAEATMATIHSFMSSHTDPVTMTQGTKTGRYPHDSFWLGTGGAFWAHEFFPTGANPEDCGAATPLSNHVSMEIVDSTQWGLIASPVQPHSLYQITNPMTTPVKALPTSNAPGAPQKHQDNPKAMCPWRTFEVLGIKGTNGAVMRCKRTACPMIHTQTTAAEIAAAVTGTDVKEYLVADATKEELRIALRLAKPSWQ